jgi:hypothetical protein
MWSDELLSITALMVVPGSSASSPVFGWPALP